MKNSSFRFVVVASVLAATGCSGSGSGVDQRIIQMPDAGEIVETVNGTAVPESLFDAFAKRHRLDTSKPKQRERALKLITDYVLMAQEAKRQGWIADPDFRAQVEVARLQGLADTTLRQLGAQTPISDSMLKTEYDAEVKRSGRVSYDFTQLLFDNQDDAIKAEGEILSGKPFSKVYDEWQRKVKQARAFTRVKRDQLPEALASALATLKNGETTKVPIKTEFGWHVVHLDIANPFTPPPFDQVKEGIRRSMQVKIARQRLEKLREQAKVAYPAGQAAKTPQADGAMSKPSATPAVKPASAQPPAGQH